MKGKRGPHPKTLRTWLRSLNPSTLTCETADEDKSVRVPRTGKGVGRWGELVDTLQSIGATRIEAVGDEGEVLGVWTEPAAIDAPAGFAKDAADTEDERLLKSFAHMLSDAHKTALGALERVVDIQAKNFAEERKAFASTMQSMDRAMQRMARSTARYRIASGGEANEGGEDEGETQNAFVQELIESFVKGKARAAAADAGDEAAVNGKGGD
jgi:hypothetical protein